MLTSARARTLARFAALTSPVEIPVSVVVVVPAAAMQGLNWLPQNLNALVTKRLHLMTVPESKAKCAAAFKDLEKLLTVSSVEALFLRVVCLRMSVYVIRVL
jgi:hypothetical protein